MRPIAGRWSYQLWSRFDILLPDDLQNCSSFTLQHLKDARDGVITVAETGGPIPFDFKRVYYISGLNDPTSVRGGHAHKTLEQAIVCAAGSFRLDLDDGSRKASVVLDSPHAGVYVGPHVWHTLTEFAPGTVVIVLASDVYSEEDYIRNYDEFQAVSGESKKNP